MSTRASLVTGLGGAIGCQFRPTENRLYFVEFNPGNLSVLDLVPRLDVVVFSGTATMPADSSLDLTNGTSAQGGFIRWDHVDPSGGRVMRPQASCQLANLGAVDYDAVSYAGLTMLAYSQNSLHGDPGPGNPIAVGDVFGVWNTFKQPAGDFDYAKVQVLAVADDIQVRWETYRLLPAYRVLGTGYSNPEDVVIAADGDTAYVSERISGDVVRVRLSVDANRAAATVVAAGLNAPHQMALDEARGALYVVEFADPGRLQRIDLASGTVTTAFAALHQAIGLLMAADGRFAYVTEQTPAGTGTLSKIDLVTSARELLYTSSMAPLFMLSWSDAGQNAIVVTERDPANTVWSIDLNTAPPHAHPILTGLPTRPSSVGVVSPGRILVCSDQEIVDCQLTGSVFTAGGPLLLGIGFVPEDRIDPAGLADTSADPSYFFQVADCPFGGNLPLMFNHPRAIGLGASFYKVLVDGVLQHEPYSDYRWDTSASPPSFRIAAVGPDANGFYKIHQPGEVWYNAFLGGFVDTAGLAEDLKHKISVQIYSTADDGAQVDTSAEVTAVEPLIVNGGPTAQVNGIFHDGVLVPVCQIVSTGSYEFEFSVTAYHPSQWLRSWGLTAYWGNDRAGLVGGGSYPGTPSKLWNDPSTPLESSPPPSSPVVPAAPGWSCVYASDGSHPVPPVAPLDSTSYRCAHTFWLNVYDRVIDGWSFIHSSSYHQSITINLPDPPA